MSALLELCAALEIEPQAVRTAMSRLSKEGLVAGRRAGRQAFYRFSSTGLEQYHKGGAVDLRGPARHSTLVLWFDRAGMRIWPSCKKIARPARR